MALIGFMGAGKTSVGRSLARRLGWEFVDLDDRIVAAQARSIADIFAAEGEAAFRRAETDALTRLLGEESTGRVIALGGGAFAQAPNRERLRGLPIVFLDAEVEELYRRSGEAGAERPLRRQVNQFRQLYEQRLPAYMEDTVRVATDGKTVEQVAAEVAARLGLDNP